MHKGYSKILVQQCYILWMLLYTWCRCIQLDSLKNATCAEFTQAHVIYAYTTEQEFNTYVTILDRLENNLAVSDVTEVCKEAVSYVMCNYVFIPCNLTTGNPRPICTKSCDYYFNRKCKEIFDLIVRYAPYVHEYPFVNNCPNTLSHLNKFGHSLSSDSFADDCIDIAGLC